MSQFILLSPSIFHKKDTHTIKSWKVLQMIFTCHETQEIIFEIILYHINNRDIIFQYYMISTIKI